MKIDNFYVIGDVETGGFHPKNNPITEVGLVVLDSNLEKVDEYCSYVQGYHDLKYMPQALEVTGIKMSDINGGKPHKEVAKDIEALCKKYKLKGRGANLPVFVGHNIEFDIGFIDYLLKDSNIPFMGKLVDKHPMCTMWLSRMMFGHTDTMANFKLLTCCEAAGVELTDAHTALGDTIATAQLFAELVKSMRGHMMTAGMVSDGGRKERSYRF